jgi:hypothetical protein
MLAARRFSFFSVPAALLFISYLSAVLLACAFFYLLTSQALSVAVRLLYNILGEFHRLGSGCYALFLTVYISIVSHLPP